MPRDEGPQESGREREARVLAARARALAAPPPAPPEDVIATIAFDAGAERFALSMDVVLRIERPGRVARVPGAAPEILGVILVDGRPCPLVDVPTLLGAAATPAERRWAVVLGRRSPELAVAADTVDLLDVARARLVPARPPRLGTTADARVVLDGAALLAAPAPERP